MSAAFTSRRSTRQDCGALGIGAPELNLELQLPSGRTQVLIVPSFFTVGQAKAAIWNNVSDLPPIALTCLAVSNAARLVSEDVKLKKAHPLIADAYRAGHAVRLLFVALNSSPASPRATPAPSPRAAPSSAPQAVQASATPQWASPKELTRTPSWRTGSKPTTGATPFPSSSSSSASSSSSSALSALAPVAAPPPSGPPPQPSTSPSAVPALFASPAAPSPRLALVRTPGGSAIGAASPRAAQGGRTYSEEEWRTMHAVSAAAGFFIDEGMELPMDAFGAANVAIEEPQMDIPYYYEHFYGREHTNFVGTHEAVGPIVVSVSERADNGSYRAIIWTKSGDERLFISESDVKGKSEAKAMLKVLRKMQASIADVKLSQVRDAELQRRLAEMELRQIVNNYKFGVLYAREGQRVEEEMFANRETSAEFEDFLGLLGERIALRGWQDYRGGLDVKGDLTGTHSVYTKWRDYELMFHVSTLLPFFPNDRQQLERKRHIGNDIVVLVFVDGATPYSPTTISSNFNHVFFVVNPIRSPNGGPIKYKLTIAGKDGVRRWKPLMPTPAIFERTPAFREFLLTKLVNAERAAYHAPAFGKKISRTRQTILANLIAEFADK